MINDTIDQEFEIPLFVRHLINCYHTWLLSNTREVPLKARVVIEYKLAQDKRKYRVKITHAILHEYLKGGGTGR